MNKCCIVNCYNNVFRDLNHTGLSGPLQPGLPYAFPVLQALRMAYNNLSGPIPSTFANFSNLQRLVIKPGNPYLCGPIPNNLPFQLCNDLDLSCLKVPVVLRPVCPPSLEPVPEYAGYHGGGDPGVGPGPGSSANAGAAPLQNGGGNVAGAASTIPAAIGVPPSQDPNTANYDGHGSADIGAIVGGVVGGVLGLLFVIGITLAIILMVVDRRRRRRRQLQNFDDKSSRPSLLPFFSHEELQRSSLQQAPQPVHKTYDAPALVPATLSPQESHPLLSTLLSSMRLSHSNSSHTGKYSSGIQEVELSEPYAKAIMPPVLNDLSIDPNGESFFDLSF